MVMAKLHVICGNCGSNEHLSHKIERNFIDTSDYQEDTVVIVCANCVTWHTLDDSVPLIRPPKEKR